MRSTLILLIALPCWWSTAAMALPLRAGLYWGGGSRYIAIAQQGDRICYQGSSSNGTTVASVYPVSQKPGIYRVHRWNLLLAQPTTRKLLFDSSEYTIDGSVEMTEDLKQCLRQGNPFFRSYRYN